MKYPVHQTFTIYEMLNNFTKFYKILSIVLLKLFYLKIFAKKYSTSKLRVYSQIFFQGWLKEKKVFLIKSNKIMENSFITVWCNQIAKDFNVQCIRIMKKKKKCKENYRGHILNFTHYFLLDFLIFPKK